MPQASGPRVTCEASLQLDGAWTELGSLGSQVGGRLVAVDFRDDCESLLFARPLEHVKDMNSRRRSGSRIERGRGRRAGPEASSFAVGLWDLGRPMGEAAAAALMAVVVVRAARVGARVKVGGRERRRLR